MFGKFDPKSSQAMDLTRHQHPLSHQGTRIKLRSYQSLEMQSILTQASYIYYIKGK